MTQIAFKYQALDRRGKRMRGVLRADNRNEAYRQVRAAGLQPLNIKTVRIRMGRSRKVTVKDLAHFTYQFSVLMEARIPIVDGLRSIAEQESHPGLRQVINEAADKIASGGTVTEAFAANRDLFGEVYIETMRAAERSGNMTLVLATLAEMLEKQYEINKNVRGALLYPICVVGALILAATFLMIFVVPKFGAMFSARGIELPLPTKLLIFTSTFVRTYWYALILGIGAAAWTVREAWRRPRSRRAIDTMLHRLPFLRDVLRGLAISRFANILGLSLRSGLNLMEALDMSGRASGRPLMMADTEKMREQVNHGGRLADVLLTCSYLPAFTRRMLTAGEEAADLPKMCSVVARHYDREVAHLTKNVTTFIEPLLIVGLAGIVLLVALAIFLPMWNMTALIG
jgi:type II secretory pathway component PulF